MKIIIKLNIFENYNKFEIYQLGSFALNAKLHYEKIQKKNKKKTVFDFIKINERIKN